MHTFSWAFLLLYSTQYAIPSPMVHIPGLRGALAAAAVNLRLLHISSESLDIIALVFLILNAAAVITAIHGVQVSLPEPIVSEPFDTYNSLTDSFLLRSVSTHLIITLSTHSTHCIVIYASIFAVILQSSNYPED